MIELAYTDRRAPVPDSRATETHGPVRLWRDGDRLSLSYDRSVTAVVTAAGISAGGMHPDLPDAWRYLFHFGLPHVLALHDRFVLHAAAVVRNGRAHLVFGDSGAGKSTLVLAALGAGWSALGDDLVVVRPGNGRPEVCGIGKPFRVPIDVLAGGSARSTTDPRDRRVIEHHEWTPGWYPVDGSIAVAHGSTARVAFDALPGTAATEMVMRSFLAFIEPDHLRRCFPVAAAIGRCGAVRLAHASDPAVRLAEAARALTEIAGHE